MLAEHDITLLSGQEEKKYLAMCAQYIHNPVKLVEKLKKRYSEDKVSDIAELLESRYAARAKFGRAEQMFFTREGLEQSTSEQVSLFKGEHYFRAADCVDLCCGIGGTAVGMAQHAGCVRAVDIDALHLKMAEYNVGLYSPDADCVFKREDVTQALPDGDLYHFDPSRRQGLQRTFDPEEYSPPLSFTDTIREKSPDVIVKVSPLFTLSGSDEYSADILSFSGEVKEILLCYGRFRQKETRAIMLPETTILVRNPVLEEQAGSDVMEYIYDPDPAVVKGDMCGTLAHELGISIIVPGVRYMTSDTYVESPAVKPFRVKQVFPFSYRHVNRYFKRHSIGNISVKCKDSLIKTGSITKRLKPKGKGTAALFYIDRGDQDRIFVAAEPVGM